MGHYYQLKVIVDYIIGCISVLNCHAMWGHGSVHTATHRILVCRLMHVMRNQFFRVHMSCEMKYSEHHNHCLVIFIDCLLSYIQEIMEEKKLKLLVISALHKRMDSPLNIWGISFACPTIMNYFYR